MFWDNNLNRQSLYWQLWHCVDICIRLSLYHIFHRLILRPKVLNDKRYFIFQPCDHSVASDAASRHRNFKRVVTRFSQKTSMQGVSYIHDSKRLIARGIWICLLLGAIAFLLFHLYYLFDQFFRWPKQTKITLGFSNLKFPALTICNVNIVRKSKLHMASERMRTFTDSLSPENLIRKSTVRNYQNVSLFTK